MRKRIRLIANPVSGRGRGGRLAKRIAALAESEGSAVDVVETRRAGDARRFAGESAGLEAVACLGGDGTVNEALNGLPETGAPPLAMIPGGTANVLAKELRLPRRPAGLVRMLLHGPEVPWDAGIDRESGRKLLLFMSAGFDAHVVHDFHAVRRGPIRMWQYVLRGLRTLREFPVPRMTVELDGKVAATDASWVQVSNVSAYGGPLVFTPRARPDNGRFEVMIHRGRWRRDAVRMIWRGVLTWLTGVDLPLPDLTFHPARRVRLHSTDGRPVPIQIDGDPAGRLPADVAIIPRAARLLGPA